MTFTNELNLNMNFINEFKLNTDFILRENVFYSKTPMH